MILLTITSQQILVTLVVILIILAAVIDRATRKRFVAYLKELKSNRARSAEAKRVYYGTMSTLKAESNIKHCFSCGWTGDRGQWEEHNYCPACGRSDEQFAGASKLIPRGVRNYVYPAYRSYPSWYLLLNTMVLAPLCLYPMVLLATVFIFDTGVSSKAIAMALSIVIGYPLIFLVLFFVSARLYHRARIVSLILTCVPIAVYALGFLWIVFGRGRI